MDFDNSGIAAARIAFDSVDLFSIHCGIEIDAELAPAMTIAALRSSGVAGEADLPAGMLKDVADLISESLEAIDEDDLRAVVSELSAGGAYDVDGGQMVRFAGRPDLLLAAAIVYDAVHSTVDADYVPMTDAVSFLTETVDGFRPTNAPSPAMAF